MSPDTPESGFSGVSASVSCRLCGMVIAAEESFAVVGLIMLHFACWITRVRDRQAHQDALGRPRTALATVSR
jgi:hypothetical protein